MFTFQVIRLTSVVVYMKWFRSKCKRQARAGDSAWPGCLHPHVLPASPRPACVPRSCLLLPWCRQHPRWPGAPQGLPSLAPFSPCPLCEQQHPRPAGGERVSGKGAITLHPSSVGRPWRGAGKRPAETQTTSLPFPNPRGVCAEPTDPQPHLG